MKTEILTIEEALSLGRALPWAFVRSFGGVALGAGRGNIPTDDLLEARFFAPKEEIRLFRRNGVLTAVRLVQEEYDRPITEVYTVNHANFCGELTICRDLSSDEDGQMFAASTRLSEWKEASGRA